MDIILSLIFSFSFDEIKNYLKIIVFFLIVKGIGVVLKISHRLCFFGSNARGSGIFGTFARLIPRWL